MSLLDLIEVVPAPEIFCTELSCVEPIGKNVRFILSTMGAITGCGPTMSRQVAAKIILPYDAVWPGIDLTTRTLGRAVAQRMLKLVP